jgi:hypothetical protein
MTSVGISAPAGLVNACAAWARAAGATTARRGRPATEYWVFALGGKLPEGVPRHVPLKFFALTETIPLQVMPLPHLPPDQLPERRDLLPPAARAEDTKRGLEAVASRLRSGASYAEMEAEVNRLLGTEMEARDADVEGDWELHQAERRGEVIDP